MGQCDRATGCPASAGTGTDKAPPPRGLVTPGQSLPCQPPTSKVVNHHHELRCKRLGTIEARCACRSRRLRQWGCVALPTNRQALASIIVPTPNSERLFPPPASALEVDTALAAAALLLHATPGADERASGLSPDDTLVSTLPLPPASSESTSGRDATRLRPAEPSLERALLRLGDRLLRASSAARRAPDPTRNMAGEQRGPSAREGESWTSASRCWIWSLQEGSMCRRLWASGRARKGCVSRAPPGRESRVAVPASFQRAQPSATCTHTSNECASEVLGCTAASAE